MRKKLKLKHSATVTAVYIIIRVTVIAVGAAAIFHGRYYTAFQCLLSLALFMLPTLLEREFAIELPNTLEVLVILFIFASTFLGEVQGYYEQFPFWDTLLHTVSGFLTTSIGISMIDILSRSEHTKFTLTPGVVSLFAFCFSMTSGVVWEFYEFAADMLFYTDMQKDVYIHGFTSVLLNGGMRVEVDSAMLNGIRLNGWLDIGLIDTMKDMLMNAIGSIVFSVFGYVYIKTRGSGWITRLLMRLKK